ncbi:unnamed protein product [Coccothraustes coccothraustes]
MAAMAALERWVSGQLQELLGLSARHVPAFLVALARRSRSLEELLERLRETEALRVEEPRVREFARQLWDKVPREAPREPPGRAAERAALELQRQNRGYRLVESDEEEGPGPAHDHAQNEPRPRRRHLRRRHRSESPPEAPPAAPSPPPAPEPPEEPEEEWEASERERLRDLRERDAFAERLRRRDRERDRGARGDSKAYEEAQKRLKMAEEDQKAMIPELRKRSRREYLAKREREKLEELEQEIQDEELLFGEEALTAPERRELRYKRRLRDLARDYKRAGAQEELERSSRYHIPEESRDKKIPEREEAQEEALAPRGRAAALGGAAAGSGRAALRGPRRPRPPGRRLRAAAGGGGDGAVRQRRPARGHRPQKFRSGGSLGGRGSLSPPPDPLPTPLSPGLHAGGAEDRGDAAAARGRHERAARVAVEMGTKLGNEVGYSIRFEDCTSERTVLKYMTDGTLLREFLTEPDLASYSVIMVDEAHERTLHTDVLFGLIKDIARFPAAAEGAGGLGHAGHRALLGLLRPRARLPHPGPAASPWTSTTPRRLRPITWRPAWCRCCRSTSPNPPGTSWSSSPGRRRSRPAWSCCRSAVAAWARACPSCWCCPSNANLPSELQARIFQPTPPGARKVVVATNIAETSVTIDGIVYVLDPGFCKQKSYSARTGMESLVVTPCSKASANQRAGRAGRVAPGKCFRLYTAWAFQHELEETAVPEIQRADLGALVLLLKSLGINDLIHFDFLDPPPHETLVLALEQLYALGALNHLGELTTLGRRMAELPVEPMLAKMILASEQ